MTHSVRMVVAVVALFCAGCSAFAIRWGGAPAQEAPEPRVPESATACNGFDALCDRRYDQVAYPTTHNAMSNEDAGWFAPNQRHGVARQLADGVRALMLDTHYDGRTPSVCHGTCLAGSRPLYDELRVIRRFLKAHPREVVTLLFEPHVAVDDMVGTLRRSGLVRYAYTHRQGAPWPTLREMIDLDQRLVIFTEDHGGSPAWYHDLWAHTWETPYHFESLGELTCRKNRGTGGASLFLLNHFITNPFPSRTAAREANREAVLGARAETCMEQGQLPNFVAVDFYDRGDLFRVVDRLNGVGPGSGVRTAASGGDVQSAGRLPEPHTVALPTLF